MYKRLHADHICRTEHKKVPASGENSPSKVGPICLIDFDDELVRAVPSTGQTKGINAFLMVFLTQFCRFNGNGRLVGSWGEIN